MNNQHFSSYANFLKAENQYFQSLGSLLWAKVGSHPFWPCMVTYDPANGTYFKRVKGRKEETLTYHVQYFGKAVTRGWTTGATFNFEGQRKYIAKTTNAVNNAPAATQKKILKIKFHVKPSVKQNWLLAVKEAEKAMSYRIEDRFELYVFKYDINFKKTQEELKKKRKRKSLLTKGSKKIQRIVTVPSNIDEPLCFYCEKGNVDLCCSSGICYRKYHKQCIGIIHAPDNFLCAECAAGREPPCFVCKSFGTNMIKCIKCEYFYHSNCMESYKCSNRRESICSAHVCWSCHVRNPKKVSSEGKFVTCFRCPVTFHDSPSCLPVGSVRLSPSLIVCPQHFLGKNKLSDDAVLNTSFCVICLEEGDLVCCENCPHAYHKECINLEEIPRGDYYCADCLSKKYLYSGMYVWTKYANFWWWPAKICNPEDLPETVKTKINYDGEFPIEFLGTHNYAWIHRGRVFLVNDVNINLKFSDVMLKKKSFQKSLEELKKVFENGFGSPGSKKKPPPFDYHRVKGNRAIPPATITHGQPGPCNCDPTNPCGPDSNCINRVMFMECEENNCPAGKLCQNLQFQKRQYVECKVGKTEKCGYGLFACNFVPKNTFIIEYVGEIITKSMYMQRVKKMRIQKLQNYYFLKLDRDRLIDAGPCGNYARFINHSCHPNCDVRKWIVNGDYRIGIFAVNDIKSGEEITFNYHSEEFGFNQVCECGQPNCSKIIGEKNHLMYNGGIKKRKKGN